MFPSQPPPEGPVSQALCSPVHRHGSAVRFISRDPAQKNRVQTILQQLDAEDAALVFLFRYNLHHNRSIKQQTLSSRCCSGKGRNITLRKRSPLKVKAAAGMSLHILRTHCRSAREKDGSLCGPRRGRSLAGTLLDARARGSVLPAACTDPAGNTWPF